MSVFVDTGAFYALADRKDPAHARATRFYKSAKHRFVTTELVFAETMSLLTKRVGKKAAVTVGEGIRNSRRILIAPASEDIREAAWNLFAGRLDKDWDLIDCTSFTFMEANGITDAFGFDRHFTQRGLRLLP